MKVEWSKLKEVIDSKNLSVQWLEIGNEYFLQVFDGAFTLSCKLDKNPSDTTELEDFEQNYKAAGNKRLESPKDADGSPLQRVKITASGWSYQLHALQFETSRLDSVHSKKPDGTDINFAAISLYKSDGQGGYVECVDQVDADQNCTMTQVDWEPTHDYEILGGMFKQLNLPANDIHFWVVGVPDVPEEYGGNKVFVSCVNLKFMGLEEGIKADGRTAKFLAYDPVLHTNKLRIILKHEPGIKHRVSLVFDIFKG